MTVVHVYCLYIAIVVHVPNVSASQGMSVELFPSTQLCENSCIHVIVSAVMFNRSNEEVFLQKQGN